MKLPFYPWCAHEEVQGRQTKLHLGFTLGKLEIPTLFCPNVLNDVLQSFLIGQWTLVYFFFAFFYKNLKNSTCVKKLSKGATACLFRLSLQALVATITELKARAGTMAFFHNCEKSNTVDLVIFACLNFREFLIWGLFTKFRIREFFFSSAIIIIIFVRFLNLPSSRNSQKLKPREYYQIYSNGNLRKR